jgi:hypothetical protein
MPPDLWIKLAADAPILCVLLLVLWRGGQKLDTLGDRIDKMTSAVRSMCSKIELVGKLQDMRLELHEERTTGAGVVDVAAVVAHRRSGNGAATPPTGIPRVSRPSWPEGASSDVEEE